MNAGDLAAGLCCARLDPPSPRLVARTRTVLQAALAASVSLPPLGLVSDLAAMLEEPWPVLQGVEVPGLPLRRYDDRIVGPLLAHRRRAALRDAYAALEPRWRGPAVALLAERLCAEIEPGGGGWEPAALRGLVARTDDEVWEEGLSALADPSVRGALSARLAGMCTRPVPEWTEADVHLVRHLPSLATRAQRLVVRQVLEASSALDRALPRTLRPRARTGSASTTQVDENKFPAGGFSSLTTSGSIENLVASELVYMDEGGGDIDLFDVRFTEGELLYYTRDESAHSRPRRGIVVALGRDLGLARVKDPALPWQRIVLALGAVHAVVERVVRWLGESDLRISVLAVGPDLSDEARTLALVLRGPIEAGVALVETVDPSDVAARVAEEAARAETDVVWIGAGSPPPELAVAPHRLDVGARSLEGWIAAAHGMAAHLA